MHVAPFTDDLTPLDERAERAGVAAPAALHQARVRLALAERRCGWWFVTRKGDTRNRNHWESVTDAPGPAVRWAFTTTSVRRAAASCTGPLAAALREVGLSRRAVATVPAATAAASAVSRGDWIVGPPLGIAHALAEVLPLTCRDLPLALPR